MENTATSKKTRKTDKKKSTKQNKTKSFSAQINCTCKKNCAQLIDVVVQKEIFDQFHGYSTWSEKTEFLRSIVTRESVKENLNPCINLKSRDYFSSYFLCDASGKAQRVCLSFTTKLLQIHRSKMFRAVTTINSNPYAVDRRGKVPTSKTTADDVAFAKEFIQSFPCYESTIESKPSSTKYFHPSLKINTIYRVYENTCTFKQRKTLSKMVFTKILKTNFSHLQPFKSLKSSCSICEGIQSQKKRKVLSPELLDRIQKREDDHLAALREIKNGLIRGVQESQLGVEILTFELQRPLEIPMLPVDESYDLRPLWLSNLCIFDELCKKAHMYVWDETIAKRGPEEVGSCLIEHIWNTIPKTTKKVILYSDATGLYRNIQIIIMLGKLFDSENHDLQTIEHRFFFEGHSMNDCNRCFNTIEKEMRKSEGLFTLNDWIQFISLASGTKQNFNVKKMDGADFFSVESIMKHVIAEKINWSDVKAVVWNRTEPLNLRLKYFSRNSEEIIPLYKEKCETLMSYSNKDGIAISKAKHDDLMKTLKFIPSEKHSYYQTIQHDDSKMDADFAFSSYNL